MARRRKRRRGVSLHPGVSLLRPSGNRVYFVMRWRDDQGEAHQRSTECCSESASREVAIELSNRLQCDAGCSIDVTWSTFCSRYEDEHLVHGKRSSLTAWRTARNWYSSQMNPQFLDEVTTSSISRFAAKLRKALEENNEKARETTIASYLRQLRAAFNWAEEVGMLGVKVRIRLPKRAKGVSKLARSRPITLEEFERIIVYVPKVRKNDPDRWTYFLRGLWEGGFRLDELVQLSWSAGQPLSIDSTGKYPLVRILAEGEKAHHDRLQPITREFWDLLCETPLEKRYGSAFPLSCGSKRACRIISDIGRKAGVITDPSTGKCATSHDIGRRALTTRLGERLTESQLAQWMRHESPETTRQYYNLPTAMALSAKLWGELD